MYLKNQKKIKLGNPLKNGIIGFTLKTKSKFKKPVKGVILGLKQNISYGASNL